MPLMKVKAATGLRVPKEDNPARYIDDQTFVDVPDSAYYRRLLQSGDLQSKPASRKGRTDNTVAEMDTEDKTA
ncbi:TPA: hypothetical protein RMN47_000305 [Escherichia coli]|nr:hypothetical protein [Escherichia coli]